MKTRNTKLVNAKDDALQKAEKLAEDPNSLSFLEADVAEQESELRISEQEATSDIVPELSGLCCGSIAQKVLEQEFADEGIHYNDANVEQSEDSASDARVAELEAQLLRSEENQRSANEKYLRIAADYDNFRKRSQRENENYKKRELEKIISDFLAVMDNLERAIKHAKQSDSVEGLLQGVELVQRQYAGVLAKFGCQPFDSVGQIFDPDRHDAFHRVFDKERDDNLIVEELQRGYTMNERVLRPALVVVSKQEQDL
ncbi:MAG: nucleotide exchange factor GrpE [Bradymonadales bacterium]